MTRCRATDPMFEPNALMAKYYEQRAGAGLILTEGTGINPEGLGIAGAPGIWSAQQAEAWKQATAAVHNAGGKIICQLWHMGRLAHPYFTGLDQAVSCSATTAPGHAHTPEGYKDFETARPLGLDEIPRLIEDYRNAAQNAKNAGFDGVQLHAANGYLIDQFLRDGTNFRDDEYGGPIENRVRLLREVLEVLIEVWGADRVGVRLSPNGDSQGCDDSNPAATFSAAAQVCQELELAYVELRQPGPDGTYGSTDVPQQDALVRSIYKGPLILNSDYGADDAVADVESGRCDAVSFGRPYISNPDLEKRIRVGAEWAPNKGAPKTWYLPGEVGYTDYPTLAEEELAKAG